MKLSEHLSGYRTARTQAQALDPSLPRLARSPVANFWGFRQNALEVLRAASSAGDVVRVDLLYKPTVFVQHPDVVREIFEQPEVWRRGEGLVPLIGRNVLTTNGDEWRFNRQMVQPSFHPAVTARASAAFARDAAGEVDAWERHATSGEPFDVARHAVRLFARWATPQLGLRLTDAEADRYPDALLRLQKWGFRQLAGGGALSAQTAEDMALLEGIIARALATPAPPNEPPSYVERLRQDHAVDRARLRDHLMLALIASADNPPNVFAYVTWLLAQNPAQQDAARAEVAAALGREAPTVESLDRLPLVERIVQESMRLLPAVWFLARFAQADTVLRGYRIPAGAMVLPSPYFVHRHPSAWDAPESFRPDRFLPEAVEKRSRYAYLPFGAGPRMCVGARLATLEIRLLLVLFLQRFRALPVSPEPLPLEGFFALRSRHGVPVRLAPVEG